MNLIIVDDPVDVELGQSGHHQVFLIAGDEVTVDGELHGGGVMSLTEHRVHPDASTRSQPGGTLGSALNPPFIDTLQEGQVHSVPNPLILVQFK